MLHTVVGGVANNCMELTSSPDKPLLEHVSAADLRVEVCQLVGFKVQKQYQRMFLNKL